MKAVFAVDAGNATGVVHALIDENAETVERAIQLDSVTGFTLNHKYRYEKQRMYRDTLNDVQGNTPYSDLHQAAVIYEEFRRWKRQMYRDGIQPDDIELVIEDFILLPGPHAGGRDGVASVRVAWAIVGYQAGIAAEWQMRHKQLHASLPIWQSPSRMGTVSDDRLKRLDLWTAGREHERSAMKHLVVRASALIK